MSSTLKENNGVPGDTPHTMDAPPQQNACTKLHEVVDAEHFQVLRQVMLAEREGAASEHHHRPSMSDARHLDLWIHTLLPSEDVLWQLLRQLTHAKHQLTRTRWRTHDALIRQALRSSMDLAISEEALAACGVDSGFKVSLAVASPASGGSGRRSRSAAGGRQHRQPPPPPPTRRPRAQVTQENKELFEMWRQRMQKTESLVRSVRDELARVMNQRILVLLQVFAGHTGAGQQAIQNIQQRLAAADGTVRHKCMVDGEDSQSDEEEEEEEKPSVGKARRRPSSSSGGKRSSERLRPPPPTRPRPPPPPPPDESDQSVHLHMTLSSND